MLNRIATYGAALAAGALALAWAEHLFFVRVHPGEAILGLVALAFLAVGVWVGLRLRAPAVPVEEGNPRALATLGISPRELEVLRLLERGTSNKEIARALGISTNTVKTHVSRVYEKLDARRRTDAVRRARELGLIR